MPRSLCCLAILSASWSCAAAVDVDHAPGPAPTDPAIQAPTAPAPASAPAPGYSAAEQAGFLARARALHLAADPYWLTLLHTSGHTNRTSRVADPNFFLAASGRTDPEAELLADIEGLFAAVPADPKRAAMNRFPGRAEWLCTQLGITRERLPVPTCGEFEGVFTTLSPRGAALVFPAAYMNTPASMFGHTLLMIRSRYRSTLLSQSVNYAAVTTDSNGLVFAIRGIFGLYHGYYSFLPYYQKVQEYSDLDQRDIWEYDLGFDAAEVRRMVLHIWEMRGIYSDYYFFDENCSFNLMYLLDSARPGLTLHEHAALWVIPLDTVKAVRSSGLITNTTFRPSRTTKVEEMASRLTSAQAQVAHDLAVGRITPQSPRLTQQSPAVQASILELSGEYLESLRGRRKVAQRDFQERILPILKARSAIPVQPEALESALPLPSAPDQGHSSSRLSVGGGTHDGSGFSELAYRPVYHDLTDPIEGYLSGSQIEFADLSLRYYDQERRVALDRFDAISLRSFPSVDRFYQPVAWEVDTGVLRQEFSQKADWHDQVFATGGAGLATLSTDVGMLYGLIDVDVRLGGRHPNHAIGAGPSIGLLAPFGRHYFIGATADAQRYQIGDKATNWRAGILQRVTFTRDFSMTFELMRERTWGYEATTAALRTLWYF